jgi:hypothetical protein
MIVTFKKLQQHLGKILKSGKISQFTLLKKDGELDQVVRSSAT